jgi:benzoyl-CoA reductase/2-hydroxyglutaryl-CoA dehydratase subunit BcrC/BadD/HgdB
MNKIGLTTTVPIEVLLAAGRLPVDLNNLFVTSEQASTYISLAESDGFPKSMCAWIKGIYGACITHNITEVVGVTEGDCTNTKCLLDIFELKGIKLYPFAFPHGREVDRLQNSIKDLEHLFGVSTQEVEEIRVKLAPIRELSASIDTLTVTTGQANGFENHLYQVSMSDLGGEGLAYYDTLKRIYKKMIQRPTNFKKLRLAYLGVPPMTGDIYEYIESLDAMVVYNEVQNEFAFPRAKYATSIVHQYLDYTYPYDNKTRITAIKDQLKLRKVDGIIHYTQAFCHRAIDDILMKHHIDLPILHIEGDTSTVLDARTKLRLEAFLDMLSDKKDGVTCEF